VTLSLTPRRRRGVEWLDDPAIDDATRARSHRDIVRSNALFGGRRAILRHLPRLLSELGPRRATVLDVGTGLADIPVCISVMRRAPGCDVATIGIDVAPSLLASSRARLPLAVCASATALPLPSACVDIAIASQLLHHFEHESAVAVLKELDRVARHAVIVGDLRRSWLAAAGFWLAAWVWGFHRITRHDGVVSVLRGFTATELASLVHEATGRQARVTRSLGFRLTAVWTPSPTTT
jgi:SAM-dependent methyltransferase